MNEKQLTEATSPEIAHNLIRHLGLNNYEIWNGNKGEVGETDNSITILGKLERWNSCFITMSGFKVNRCYIFPLSETDVDYFRIQLTIEEVSE